jgi:hypothetical protein
MSFQTRVDIAKEESFKFNFNLHIINCIQFEFLFIHSDVYRALFEDTLFYIRSKN